MITQCYYQFFFSFFYYQTQDLFKALEENKLPTTFFFFHDCLRIL
ncbi:hypothetical protein SPFM14_00285 [Salmonella phage SPFM14]|nr:hypothetical protein SPFM14_00285 [Salmonella phage SPFM14]